MHYSDIPLCSLEEDPDYQAKVKSGGHLTLDILRKAMEKKMPEQSPNHGVKWILGCYKIELTVFPGCGANSRNLIIENKRGVSGLYHSKLFLQLQNDIDTLKATAMSVISKAREEENAGKHDVQDSQGEQPEF